MVTFTTHGGNAGAIIIKPVKRSTIKIRAHTEGKPHGRLIPIPNFSAQQEHFSKRVRNRLLGADDITTALTQAASFSLSLFLSLNIYISLPLSVLEELLVRGAETATAAPKMKHVAFALWPKMLRLLRSQK